MRPTGMGAGGKGIQPPDPVDESKFDQKVERAIGNGRLLAESVFGKPFQNLVGPHCTMRFQQDFQRPPPHGRQPRATFSAQFIRARQGILRAMAVIVVGKGQTRTGI